MKPLRLFVCAVSVTLGQTALGTQAIDVDGLQAVHERLSPLAPGGCATRRDGSSTRRQALM